MKELCCIPMSCGTLTHCHECTSEIKTTEPNEKKANKNAMLFTRCRNNLPLVEMIGRCRRQISVATPIMIPSRKVSPTNVAVSCFFNRSPPSVFSRQFSTLNSPTATTESDTQKRQELKAKTNNNLSLSEQLQKQQQHESSDESDGANTNNKQGSKSQSSKHREAIRKIFIIALLSALCVPLVQGGLGKLVCDYLNRADEREFERQLEQQLNMDEQFDFVLKLVKDAKISRLLQPYIGDTSAVRRGSEKVLIQASKTLYLKGALTVQKQQQQDGGDEGKQQQQQVVVPFTHHMKGVCHLYFPIITAKGSALLKLTMVTGEKAQDGSLPLHRYSLYLIPTTNRKHSLHSIVSEDDREEDNRFHHVLTGDQIYELFEHQTKDYQSVGAGSISMVTVGLKKDILLFDGGAPDGILQRESSVLQYRKNMEVKIVETRPNK